MNVCATGMPWARANFLSSSDARPRITPLPAKISGNDAASISRAAVSSAWRAGARRAPAGERPPAGRPPRHVLGHLDVAGARLLRLGQLERLADHLGDDTGRLHARVPLGERPEVLDDVDPLVGFLVNAIAPGLAGERDQRRAVEVRVGDAGGQIRGARPERGQTDAGAPRQAPVGGGHERGPLLVARRDEGDPRVEERIEDIQHLLARQAEDVAHAFVLEALDDQIRGLHAIQTDLMLTNSRMPYSDSSRP